MAKRKIKGKEVGLKGAKEAAKLAEKETTVHKPTEAKAKPKVKSNLPSDIEYPLAQTDKLADGSKEVDIGKPDTEISTGKMQGIQTDDQPGDVNEVLIEDTDIIESRIEEADGTQTDNQTAGVIEVAEETEKLAEEVESLQIEDEQAGIAIEAEDSDAAESLSQKTEDTQIDKLVDDMSELFAEDSVAAQSPTGDTEDTKTDDQPSEVIEGAVDAEEAVIGDSTAEAEGFTEGTGDFHTDEQEKKVVETVIENPESIENLTEKVDDTLTDKQVGDADKDVIESPETVTNHTGKADDTRTDGQLVSSIEANVEGSDDEIQTAVYSDKKPYRAKKTGIIISVFIVIAAVVLLVFASIERRSAEKTIVQISKIAGSIRQMQEEALKDREQVTHSQIESRDLVIDALSLTRNGLELERVHSDEVEVKRIIDVFISDIDERITKIKDDIALLRNKLKETD